MAQRAQLRKSAHESCAMLIKSLPCCTVCATMATHDQCSTALAHLALYAVPRRQRLARNMSHLGKITRELQDLTMAMRMGLGSVVIF